MKFMGRPAFIMYPVVIVEASKTMAAGAVATGNMKAQQQVITDESTENKTKQVYYISTIVHICRESTEIRWLFLTSIVEVEG